MGGTDRRKTMRDIGPILDGWPLEDPDRWQTRLIEGEDGRPKIQVRLDLGLLQLETEGRPDGERPHGFPSLLAYYQDLAARCEAHFTTEPKLRLGARACAELQREALQYYYRRLSWFELGEYERAAEDAQHNLQIMDLLKAYAARAEDWWASEQYRPFVLCHYAEAKALAALEREDFDAALQHLEEGLQALREVYEERGQPEAFWESNEAEELEHLRDLVLQERPRTLREMLLEELRQAVQREDYERAAQLRDILRSWDEGQGA
jgi:tetratricopeptide (TPR) repeat protein